MALELLLRNTVIGRNCGLDIHSKGKERTFGHGTRLSIPFYRRLITSFSMPWSASLLFFRLANSLVQSPLFDTMLLLIFFFLFFRLLVFILFSESRTCV